MNAQTLEAECFGGTYKAKVGNSSNKNGLKLFLTTYILMQCFIKAFAVESQYDKVSL